MERRELKIDWLTVLLFVVFVILGWLNIYAASNQDTTQSIFNLSFDYGRQFIWILAAGGLALVIMGLNSRLIEFTSYGVYGLCMLMLIAVLVVGRDINGARSWIEIGSFRLQPSEFAKVATALAVAKYMSRFSFSLNNWADRLVCGGLILLPTLLIILQKDMGTALVFSAFIFMFYREGMSPLILIILTLVGIFSVLALVLSKVVVILVIIGLSLLSYFYLFRQRFRLLHTGLALLLILQIFSIDYLMNSVLQPHQRERIIALVQPEKDPLGVNWNSTQSKIAIGSGGFLGKGFLKGTQTKGHFVPQQTTDFIFCTIGEERGWVGATLLLVLFGVFLAQLLFLAENAKSVYARVFGYSIASILFVHIAINIAMTIGLAPVIGIPLPFFSYGGSSLLAFTTMVFILLNFYANRINILSSDERIR